MTLAPLVLRPSDWDWNYPTGLPGSSACRQYQLCKSLYMSKAREPGLLMSEGRRRWVSQLRQERTNLPFLQLLVLFRPSTDCMLPTHIVEGNLYLVY